MATADGTPVFPYSYIVPWMTRVADKLMALGGDASGHLCSSIFDGESWTASVDVADQPFSAINPIVSIPGAVVTYGGGALTVYAHPGVGSVNYPLYQSTVAIVGSGPTS